MSLRSLMADLQEVIVRNPEISPEFLSAAWFLIPVSWPGGSFPDLLSLDLISYPARKRGSYLAC